MKNWCRTCPGKNHSLQSNWECLRTLGRIVRPAFYDIQDEMKIFKQQPKPHVKVGKSSWMMDARKRIECKKCSDTHSRCDDDAGKVVKNI